ncbi:MAG: NAD(P)(+) transhydrogenase (Re/Si-specific) subunit beta [Bacillota bacterium]
MDTYAVVSIVLAAMVLGGLKLMSSPKTAVFGNLLGAFSMLASVILVLWTNDLLFLPLLWVAMMVGSLVGAIIGLNVTMIQMPQMVALLNGFGGGASALVALVEIFEKSVGMDPFSKFTGELALIVGAVTLSGSLVAAGKLDRRLTQRPVVLPNHVALSTGSLVLMGGLSVASLFAGATALDVITALILVLGLSYGVLFAVRVGGADMPVTISLLNSFSGLAGAICGFTVRQPLLVAMGAIVGASGLILTQIMCRAMNRSLADVLSGATRATSEGTKVTLPKSLPESPEYQAAPQENKNASSQVTREPDITSLHNGPSRQPLEDILKAAKKVIIAPGYGMAIAQAQSKVRELMDAFLENGAQVKFAVHPVAGRMPGHMNVLLAEVDVPYELMCEMDDINPQFKDTDLGIVVGACDVVNPAASTAEGTPIYGMPVLKIEECKNVIVCNLDTKPGYSGVNNTLYDMEHVRLVLGDAAETVKDLTAMLKRVDPVVPEAEVDNSEGSVVPSDEEETPKRTLEDLLKEAKTVVIVPGYGMAIAQAQSQVKSLLDALSERGAQVKFAIHPVAGRMPGHMNVLLAEVDVPYELMCQMDEINPEFKNTDLGIVVGACDVVNPAANTTEGTPIYGMPVLKVEECRDVIVCNLDTKPGYSGVDNTLYDMEHVRLVLGNAAETVQRLVDILTK